MESTIGLTMTSPSSYRGRQNGTRSHLSLAPSFYDCIFILRPRPLTINKSTLTRIRHSITYTTCCSPQTCARKSCHFHVDQRQKSEPEASLCSGHNQNQQGPIPSIQGLRTEEEERTEFQGLSSSSLPPRAHFLRLFSSSGSNPDECE